MRVLLHSPTAAARVLLARQVPVRSLDAASQSPAFSPQTTTMFPAVRPFIPTTARFTLRPDYYQGGNRSHLERLVFDLSSDTCVGRHQLMTRTMEFPSPNWDYSGKPHTHVYCSGDVVDDPKYWGPSQVSGGE